MRGRAGRWTPPNVPAACARCLGPRRASRRLRSATGARVPAPNGDARTARAPRRSSGARGGSASSDHPGCRTMASGNAPTCLVRSYVGAERRRPACPRARQRRASRVDRGPAPTAKLSASTSRRTFPTATRAGGAAGSTPRTARFESASAIPRRTSSSIRATPRTRASTARCAPAEFACLAVTCPRAGSTRIARIRCAGSARA